MKCTLSLSSRSGTAAAVVSCSVRQYATYIPLHAKGKHRHGHDTDTDTDLKQNVQASMWWVNTTGLLIDSQVTAEGVKR